MVSFQKIDRKTSRGKQRFEKIDKLLFFNNDFKRAGKSTGRTHGFTIGTPMAVFGFNNSNLIFYINNGTTGTNTNAKAALITFFLVNYRHFSQLLMPPYIDNIEDSGTAVCDLCLNLTPLLFLPKLFD